MSAADVPAPLGGTTYPAERELLGLQYDTLECADGLRTVRVIVYDIPQSPVTDTNTDTHTHTPSETDLTLFFVHGSGGRAGQNKNQLVFLKTEIEKVFPNRKCRLVAFDQLGHGESPRPMHDESLYSIGGFSETAISIFRKYMSPKRNVIIGHSLGTVVTLNLFSKISKIERETVKGLCLLGGGVGGPKIPSLILNIPVFLLEIIRPMFRNASNKSLFHESALQAETLVRSENDATNFNPMFVIRSIGRDLAKGSWEQAVADGVRAWQELPAPQRPRLLFVTGRADPITPLKGAEALRDRFIGGPEQKIPKGVNLRVIEEASHNFMLERPEEWNQKLLEFVQETCAE